MLCTCAHRNVNQRRSMTQGSWRSPITAFPSEFASTAAVRTRCVHSKVQSPDSARSSQIREADALQSHPVVTRPPSRGKHPTAARLVSADTVRTLLGEAVSFATVCHGRDLRARVHGARRRPSVRLRPRISSRHQTVKRTISRIRCSSDCGTPARGHLFPLSSFPSVHRVATWLVDCPAGPACSSGLLVM